MKKEAPVCKSMQNEILDIIDGKGNFKNYTSSEEHNYEKLLILL